MNPLRRFRFWLACGLMAVMAGGVMAESLDLATAINKSGRQRMLSQRMAKAYAQQGMGVQADRAKKILEESVSLFDRQLVELKVFAPTPEIKSTFSRLDAAWGEYKVALIGSDPSKAGARQIAELSDKVMIIANEATGQLAKHSGKAEGRLINISGRQRMLSQRIAKFYFLERWGAGVPDAGKELDAAARMFQASHKELSAATQNTTRINEELGLAGMQWQFFEAAINQSGIDRSKMLKDVATTSERILQQMDLVTGLYSGLPQ